MECGRRDGRHRGAGRSRSPRRLVAWWGVGARRPTYVYGDLVIETRTPHGMVSA